MNSGQDDFNDDSSDDHKQFTFTIQDGVVTAYFEVENGITEQESIDSADTFVIDDNLNQITLTKQTSNGPEITVFSDVDDDGFYTVASSDSDDFNDDNDDDDHEDDQSGHDHKAFMFDIENGEVTAVFELDDGVWKPKSIDDDGSETYTVDGADVIRTEVKPFGTEITRYSDTDLDGVYFRASEQWQISPDASGIVPQLHETLRFSPTDDDDFIAVREGEDCFGGHGADDFVIREAAHLRINDFNSLEDDMLVFDTGLGLTSQAHLASFVTGIHHDGQNFIVDFGPDVSITLVGVQPDQISWDDVSVLS